MAESFVLAGEGVKADMILRRARKSHRCKTHRAADGVVGRGWDGGPLPAGHTDVIDTGAQYVEYPGESAAYSSGSRYCAACAVAAGLLESDVSGT